MRGPLFNNQPKPNNNPMKTENHVAEIHLGFTIIKIKRVFHVTHPARLGTTIFPNINVAKQWIETQNLETVDINGVPTVVCVDPVTRVPLEKTTDADNHSYQKFTSNCGYVTLFVREDTLYGME